MLGFILQPNLHGLDWQNRHDDAVANVKNYKGSFLQATIKSLSIFGMTVDKLYSDHLDSTIVDLNQEFMCKMDACGLKNVNPDMYVTGVAGGLVKAGFGLLAKNTITKTATVELLSVHGNSLMSMRPTWGYKLFSQDGTIFKKWYYFQVSA